MNFILTNIIERSHL